MKSIAIVGGGVAGLVCAWKLKRAGFEVEVLEREHEPGGRMRSELRDGYVLERGAQLVASSYRNLQAAVASLGLAGRLHDVPRPRHAVLCDGRLHEADLDSVAEMARTTLLSAGAKLRLGRLALELARHWRRLDPLHPEAAAELDRESLAAGFRRLAGAEASQRLLEPTFSASFDSEPEDLSLAFGLLTLRFVAGGLQPQAFEGGNGLFPRALAEQVPVRTGIHVTSVETETGGARVHYRDGVHEGSALADAVVVAVPGSRASALCPKLTPAERGFFEHVRYVRGAIVHLLFEEAPKTLPNAGVAFPRSEGFDLYGIAVDHHKPGAAPPGAGLLNAALSERAAARLWEAPDAALADCVLENLAATPIGVVRPFGFAVQRWEEQLPQLGPGYLPRLARFLARLDRSPRLAFAGDYLVGPSVEGAVASGMRAATEVAGELR